MKLTKFVKPFSSVISALGWLNIEEVVIGDDLTAGGEPLPEGINDPVFDPTFYGVEFNHAFSVSGSVLNYKLTNVTKDRLLLNLDIDLQVIKSHSGFADQTLWGIKDSVLEQHKNGFVGQEPYAVVKEDLVPFLVQSYTSKDPLFTSMFPVRIYVPGKEITADELNISMAVSDESLGAETNTVTGIEDITTIQSIENQPMWKQLISNIISSTTSTTVNVGDDIVVNISTSDPKVKEVYLEPVVGITNKTRVRLTDGQGSYIIKTSDLDSGDEVRIKHGFKWFTGVSEFTKIIS